jgi:hypothetical protein
VTLVRILTRLGLSALGFVSLGLVGAAARAEPGVSFTLDYVAPARCPGRSEFLAALRARSKLARETRGPADVRIAIELEESGDRVAGALRLRLRDGQTSERAIPESTCGEAITSMAVIAAMVIDGGSLDAPAPLSTDERSPARPAGAPPSPRASVRNPQRTEAARGQTAADRSSPWPIQLGAVIAGTMRSAVAPRRTFGMDAGFELAWRRRGWLAPILRATAGLAESAFEPVDGAGRARYRLIATSWSGCPVRLAWGPSVVGRPCAVVEVGDLQGTGSSVSGEREDHMLWLGVGVGGRFELVVADWLGLELEARALALTQHDRFVFLDEPNRVAHDVPMLAAGLQAGLVVRIP